MTENKSLTVSKIIEADKQTIFEALTRQELMTKWFYASPNGGSATVQSKAEEGTEYQIDMHGNEGNTFTHTGVYKEVVPTEKIVFTWNSHVVTDTLVTITLTQVEKGTKVTLVHDFLPNDEMAKNHTKGWTLILERLNSAVINL